MKQRKAFLLRLDPALYEALERWAAQELRSVNGQIEYVLTQAVRKHGISVREQENAKGAQESAAPQS
ncbi:MAG: hypothetical protein HYS13_25750 [Planctomycetia bacterium]|nr:hypothetical protein [Planctomycetia bacterium]